MLAPSKRVDPRTTRTRALILKAFRDVMGEKAFDDITIQDIATQATVNRATIYAHYPDKFAIMDDLIRTEFERLFARRVRENPATVAALLRGLFLAIIEHSAPATRRCKSRYKQLDAMVEGEIKSQLCDQIHTWLVKHLSPRAQQRHDLEAVAMLLSWSLYGAAVDWLVGARDRSPEQYADVVIPLLVPMMTALET